MEEEKWNMKMPALPKQQQGERIAVRLLAAGRWGCAACTNKLAVNRLVKAAMAGANVRPALPHPSNSAPSFLPWAAGHVLPGGSFAIPRSQLLELLRKLMGNRGH